VSRSLEELEVVEYTENKRSAEKISNKVLENRARARENEL